MLKAMVIRFLLGRGVNKLQELAAKGLRHGVGAAGGALIGYGLATHDQVNALQGVAGVVAAIAASAVRTFLAKYN